jgi:hypothetical protein
VEASPAAAAANLRLVIAYELVVGPQDPNVCPSLVLQAGLYSQEDVNQVASLASRACSQADSSGQRVNLPNTLVIPAAGALIAAVPPSQSCHVIHIHISKLKSAGPRVTIQCRQCCSVTMSATGYKSQHSVGLPASASGTELVRGTSVHKIDFVIPEVGTHLQMAAKREGTME